MKAAAEPLEYAFTESRRLRTERMEKVYVHDDRLGPYARMLWITDEGHGNPHLRHEPYGANFRDLNDSLVVWNAIVPLYRKLRLTAEDLLRIACELIPAVTFVTGSGDELFTDLRFALGGSYLSEILVGGLPARRKLALLQNCRLPRYVGLIRFRHRQRWLLDVLCDTTDIYRETPKYGAILAIVAPDEDVRDRLSKTLSGMCDVPWTMY